MGKLNNKKQDGLREPTGWPPDVRTKKYYQNKKWRPATTQKTGRHQKAKRVGKLNY